MNSRVLSPILFIAGMFVALYVTVSVLMSEGNNVGAFCRWLLVGGLFLGVVSPRHAFYVFIIACGYNDLLKRMLVVGGRLQWGDVPYVLGITPVLFGGILLGLLTRTVNGGVEVPKRSVTMFFVATALMLTAAVASAAEKGGGGASTLKAMADDGVYAYLLFVIPLLFTSAEEIMGLFRFVLIVFLPVGAYGIYQYIFGFSDIEIAYLKSGFCLERWQLFSEAGRRAFSTLNSSTAFSVVCAVLCLLSLYMGAWSRKISIKGLISPFLSGLVALIFFGGVMASSCRSAVLMLAVGWLIGPFFESAQKTKRIYVSVLIVFLTLVVASPYLLTNLPYFANALTVYGEGGFANWLERMTTVGTYSDRLMGFTNVLMNPSAYSLFGMGTNALENGNFYHHDPISRILIRHGLIGMAAIFALIYLVARTMHRCVFLMNSPERRHIAARFLGIAVAILVMCAVGGNYLSTFPINIFFWMLLGTCLMLSHEKPVEMTKPADAGVPLDEMDQGIGLIQASKGEARLRPSRPQAPPTYV